MKETNEILKQLKEIKRSLLCKTGTSSIPNDPCCPTTNTLLDEIKTAITDLDISVDNLVLNTDTLEINTDELESLLTALNQLTQSENDETQVLLTDVKNNLQTIIDKLNQPCGGDTIKVDVCNLDKDKYLPHSIFCVKREKGFIDTDYIGFDFELPTQFNTTDATDTYLHIIGGIYAYPPGSVGSTTPVVCTNQEDIQNFLNSTIIPNYSLNANDVLWQVNTDNTITVWLHNSVGSFPFDFWMGTSLPNGYNANDIPQIPTTHAFTLNIGYQYFEVQMVKKKDENDILTDAFYTIGYNPQEFIVLPTDTLTYGSCTIPELVGECIDNNTNVITDKIVPSFYTPNNCVGNILSLNIYDASGDSDSTLAFDNNISTFFPFTSNNTDYNIQEGEEINIKVELPACITDKSQIISLVANTYHQNGVEGTNLLTNDRIVVTSFFNGNVSMINTLLHGTSGSPSASLPSSGFFTAECIPNDIVDLNDLYFGIFKNDTYIEIQEIEFIVEYNCPVENKHKFIPVKVVCSKDNPISVESIDIAQEQTLQGMGSILNSILTILNTRNYNNFTNQIVDNNSSFLILSNTVNQISIKSYGIGNYYKISGGVSMYLSDEQEVLLPATQYINQDVEVFTSTSGTIHLIIRS
jgi:hypothetical protein